MIASAKETQEAVAQTPASDMSVETIQRRATGGLLSLALRRAVHQVISFFGNILLSRLLSPSVFGVFSIVTYVVNFFGFFGDIGLGAALVQRKEKPSERVLRTTFTIQQSLVTFFVIMVFVASPFISKKYGMSESSVWLFRAFSLSLFFTSMKVIPSILLERQLYFNRIIIPEIAEVAAYQTVAVTMAYMGYGVWSLVCATLARGVLGFTILFILSPWKLGYAFDKPTAKDLVKFGAPFQLGQFFWLIKNAATPVFAGFVCGKAAVGYLTWAWGLALVPYTIIEIINRIVFPVCSRLQHDKDMLGRSIEKFVRMSSIGVFGIAAVMMAVAPYAIKYVYTAKWTPALPALYLFLLSMMGGPIINIYSRSFYAIGRAKTAVKLTAAYVGLSWIFNVPLLLKYGFVGIAWSALLVTVIGVWLPIREMEKIVHVQIWKQVWAPLISACGTLALTRWIAVKAVDGVLTLVGVTLVGMAIYAVFMLLLQRETLIAEGKMFVTMVRRQEEDAAAPEFDG
ncbi:MAG: oligosaccharide flippase family protein [Armatimonadota bacterium]|nr:oligosaccharide flippase family protein [Armatimonadota bacterium]